MTACHIPRVYLCCRWQAVSGAIPDCWKQGKVTQSPARRPGARVGRGMGSAAREKGTQPWGAGRGLCSPSCPTLPKTVHGSISFPCGVLCSARSVHPVLPSGSRRQLVPGTEPSPWAATTPYPPKHLALTPCCYRGLLQQGSSSVLIQPCIANQLLENKEPSCFFGPGCDKSGR